MLSDPPCATPGRGTVAVVCVGTRHYWLGAPSLERTMASGGVEEDEDLLDESFGQKVDLTVSAWSHFSHSLRSPFSTDALRRHVGADTGNFVELPVRRLNHQGAGAECR